MWCTAERRVVRHVCKRNLFPSFLLRFPSIHSPPAAGSWDGQYALRCNFRKKHLSHAEKQSVWSRSCGLQDFLQYSDCALSAMWLLQTNEELPSFQLPMHSMCGTLPKGDLLDMFVSGVHSHHSFWDFQASTPYQKREAPPAHCGCIILAKDRVLVSKLWITGYSLWSCDCWKSMKNCPGSAFKF